MVIPSSQRRLHSNFEPRSAAARHPGAVAGAEEGAGARVGAVEDQAEATWAVEARWVVEEAPEVAAEAKRERESSEA